ncbi:hypothetical protein ABPG77_009794 [Micractinium sp. CCAP 211/92]
MASLATSFLPAGRQAAGSSRAICSSVLAPTQSRQHPAAPHQQQGCRPPPRALPTQNRQQPRPRRAVRVHAAADGSNPQQQPGSDEQPDAVLEKLAALADLNQLQTALNRAISAEEWELAAKIRDLLRLLVGTADGGDGSSGYALSADWRALGILGWLADRAENLGFAFPTEVQKRAAPVILDGDDCIIQSETGSGKTLAFLLPALSRLGYPPALYPDDLKGPQAVIVVPTRELGVQVVMLIYRLFGGSVNQGVPGQGGNMFDYHGPRGLKVRGLLLDSEVASAKKEGYLKGAHVLRCSLGPAGTPELIAEALAEPEALEVVQHTGVLAVDEVDACFQSHPQEMEAIMQAACRGRTQQQQGQQGQQWDEEQQWEQQAAAGGQKPVVVLVGATLDEPLVEHAAQQGWVRDPVTVRVGARMRIPSGLQHRAIVVDAAGKAAAMCRQIRDDLRRQSADEAPARVMVFAGSEEQARQLAGPLRTVLWGDHKISVLLPEGTEPIKALHSFRDNKTTLLLCTPAAARGLDLPAVSHVYNVEPPSSAAEYLHRAGRSGRIGSAIQGVVTTLVTDEQLAALQGMAAELGINIAMQTPVPPELPTAAAAEEEGVLGVDVETARRGLEDLFNLY